MHRVPDCTSSSESGTLLPKLSRASTRSNPLSVCNFPPEDRRRDPLLLRCILQGIIPGSLDHARLPSLAASSSTLA